MQTRFIKKNNIEGTILAQENLININLIKNRFKKIIKEYGIKIRFNKNRYKRKFNENMIKFFYALMIIIIIT